MLIRVGLWFLFSFLLTGCGAEAKPVIFNKYLVNYKNYVTLSDQKQPYIIQFKDHVYANDITILKQNGNIIAGYIPENSFLVLANRETLNSIKNRLTGVWQYLPPYKIESTLSAMMRIHDISTPYNVLILGFPQISGEKLVNDIMIEGGTVISTEHSKNNSIIHAKLTRNEIISLAGSNDIRWIQPYPYFVLFNDVASWIAGVRLSTDVIQQNINGYNGAGQAVAIADTGLDTGNAGLNYDSADNRFYGYITGTDFHPAFLNKEVSIYADGYPDTGSFQDDVGHGTHVADTILGYDQQTPFAGISHNGIAYGVNKLVFQDVMNRQGIFNGIPAVIGNLFNQAYNDTLAPRIHSDSWGTSNIISYDILAWSLDKFIWEHPDMLILFASGNDGTDADNDGVVDLSSISSPALAKDCLTIGATESFRPSIPLTYGIAWPNSFPVPPISTDLLANNPDGMAAFSSRGPANDGRIKPDLVAPGTFILSAKSQSIFYTDDFENGLQGFSITGTVQGFMIYPNGYKSTYALGITSMTSPVLSYAQFFTSLSIASITHHAQLNFYVNTRLLSGVLSFEVFDPSRSAWILLDTFTSTAGWYNASYPILSYFTDTGSDNLNGFGLRLTVSDSGNKSDYVMIDDISIDTVTGGWGSQSFWGISSTTLEDQRYMFLGGTSMATPVAAGSAAIVRQWLLKNGYASPSAALVKAVMINTAKDIYPGQYGTGKYLEVPYRPNNIEGWGRIDLTRLLIPSQNWHIHVFDYKEGNGLATGAHRVLQFEVLNGDPLITTLVWSDYPASPGSSRDIVNQLDVTIASPDSRIYYPNGLNQPDHTNNIQQIEIAHPQVGIYKAIVKGYNIPKGMTPLNDQPYALVISGGVFRNPVQGKLYPDRGFSCSISYTQNYDPWDALFLLLFFAVPICCKKLHKKSCLSKVVKK